MKKTFFLKALASVLFLSAFINQATAQLNNQDYKKALWMTTRMLGGQRSGGSNWLITDHMPQLDTFGTNGWCVNAPGGTIKNLVKGQDFTKDADGAHNLSGGWFDCGDHVFFGQTGFIGAYVLLKGFSEFTAGYDDYYSKDYKGYEKAGDFSWEGNKHDPDGIPDILNEVKWATDFFIKCTPDTKTFYSQKGNPNADHMNWVTSVAMATAPIKEGGQKDGSREIVKNPNDASMSSFCGATLALMSRMYRPYDAKYADECLVHAKYAYEYAIKHPSTQGSEPYYSANRKWVDDFCCLCSELYWATGDVKYKTEAEAMLPFLENYKWVFNFNNNDDLATYNLAKMGNKEGIQIFDSLANDYKMAVDPTGLYIGGDNTWGPLRYNSNTAFIVALQGVLHKDKTVNKFVLRNVGYILGDNSAKQSFVVGFTKDASYKSPQHPHHRNVYLVDDESKDQTKLEIPTRNKQMGYMVGGIRKPELFGDVATNAQTNEGGIDYNAGLVGAIAYIISVQNPVDIKKFAPKK